MSEQKKAAVISATFTVESLREDLAPFAGKQALISTWPSVLTIKSSKSCFPKQADRLRMPMGLISL